MTKEYHLTASTQGEYTTGWTGSGASKSDKKVSQRCYRDFTSDADDLGYRSAYVPAPYRFLSSS